MRRSTRCSRLFSVPIAHLVTSFCTTEFMSSFGMSESFATTGFNFLVCTKSLVDRDFTQSIFIHSNRDGHPLVQHLGQFTLKHHGTDFLSPWIISDLRYVDSTGVSQVHEYVQPTRILGWYFASDSISFIFCLVRSTSIDTTEWTIFRTKQIGPLRGCWNARVNSHDRKTRTQKTHLNVMALVTTFGRLIT